METAVSTYLDSNVLINAVGDDVALSDRALAVINDEKRRFVLSDYVWLEVIPKMIYFKQKEQLNFVEQLFRTANFVESDRIIILDAKNFAEQFGLSGMDALHIAWAMRAYAAEFITFEKPTKPFFSIPPTTLKVTSLY